MQLFKEVDGGNPDGTAKDAIGLSSGTTYFAKYWNDNFFNIFNVVTNAGYALIDDNLQQLTKALKGKYQATYTYNTSSIATQSVSDVVLGSDGKYYTVQTNGVIGDNPVGSVTGNWALATFDANTVNLTSNQTIAGTKTFTGTVAAPTPTAGDNTTKIATTAFVKTALGSALTDSGHSFNTNGYQKLSNGLILQWGQVGDRTTTISATDRTTNFPLSFPTACYFVLSNHDTSYSTAVAASYMSNASSWTTSGFTEPSTLGRTMWIAIGE